MEIKDRLAEDVLREAPALPPSLTGPDARVRVFTGDCLEVMRAIPDCTYHAIVTDPPYGLSEPLVGEDAAAVLAAWIAEGVHVRTKGRKKPAKPGGTDATSRLAGGGFMGASWDAFVPGPRVWAELLRVTRPGGYAIVAGGTRTYAWTAIAMMLAGWEIVDEIAYLYAEGFPKGGNVGERVDGLHPSPARNKTTDAARFNHSEGEATIKAPATAEGAIYDDTSTTLKPAREPWIVARRPLSEKNVAANLLKWRTGVLNIGACRIVSDETTRRSNKADLGYMGGLSAAGVGYETGSDAGRWPANVMFAHAEGCEDGACVRGCPVRELDEQSGTTKSNKNRVERGKGGIGGAGDGVYMGTSGVDAHIPAGPQYGNTGGASRFFFSAKASPKDRREGLPEDLPREREHKTVKPVPLMRELVRLVCPREAEGPRWIRREDGAWTEDLPHDSLGTAGRVLDPFGGSGSTGAAAALEGVLCDVVERDEAFARDLCAPRIRRALELHAAGECPKHWRRRGA